MWCWGLSGRQGAKDTFGDVVRVHGQTTAILLVLHVCTAEIRFHVLTLLMNHVADGLMSSRCMLLFDLSKILSFIVVSLALDLHMSADLQILAAHIGTSTGFVQCNDMSMLCSWHTNDMSTMKLYLQAACPVPVYPTKVKKATGVNFFLSSMPLCAAN